jgi:hypothetical protein
MRQVDLERPPSQAPSLRRNSFRTMGCGLSIEYVICASGQPGLGAVFYYLSLNLASQAGQPRLTACLMQKEAVFSQQHTTL